MSDLLEPDHDWQTALQAAARAGDASPTWAYDWPAGSRLAGELPSLMDLAGLRVCDLGCGRGRLGLVAARHGAEVVFCDASTQVLDYVATAIDANHLAGACHHHRWGDPIPGAPFEVILGGDILYRPECHAALLDSIAGGLTPNGRALLADPRTRLEAALPDLAAERGLGWSADRREAGYSLVTVHRV